MRPRIEQTVRIERRLHGPRQRRARGRLGFEHVQAISRASALARISVAWPPRRAVMRAQARRGVFVAGKPSHSSPPAQSAYQNSAPLRSTASCAADEGTQSRQMSVARLTNNAAVADLAEQACASRRR